MASLSYARDREEIPLVEVELYYPPHPNKSGKKRAGRRDQGEELKRVKGKASWSAIGVVSQPRATTTWAPSGDWRKVLLKFELDQGIASMSLIDNDGRTQRRAVLSNIPSTCVREAHPSLLGRLNTLGIHNQSSQMLDSYHTDPQPPIYLSFTSTELLHSWMTLIKAYTRPETFGEGSNRYRISRKMKLEVVQVSLASAGKWPLPTIRPTGEETEGGLELMCDISLNDQDAGRTVPTPQQTSGWSWTSIFNFDDISEVKGMRIEVYRVKKGNRGFVGSASISLDGGTTGQQIDGYFPLQRKQSELAEDVMVGEVRLRYTVHREIVLQQSHYEGVLKILDRTDVFDLLADLEQRMQVKKCLAEHIVAVVMARQKLREDILFSAESEVKLAHAHNTNTLFRGNSVFTKSMELAMHRYGETWLELSLGGPIRAFCSKPVVIDLESRSKDQGAPATALEYWCKIFWKSIQDARDSCPEELSTIFSHIRRLVDELPNRPELLELQTLSAFLFLRFFVPAIMHPELWNLWPETPPPQVQISLKLVAKNIQTLANLNKNVPVDNRNRRMRDFMDMEHSTMTTYLKHVSRPERHKSSQKGTTDSRLQMMEALRVQAKRLPSLERESIPVLPFFVDVPSHLASIATTVARQVRRLDRDMFTWKPSNKRDGWLARLAGFVYQCILVEARVSQAFLIPRRAQLSGPSFHALEDPRAAVSSPASSAAEPETFMTLEDSEDSDARSSRTSAKESRQVYHTVGSVLGIPDTRKKKGLGLFKK